MTLHFQVAETASAELEDVDLTEARIAKLKLNLSYDGPSRLSWVMYAPHHTRPIPYFAFVRVWDDSDDGASGAHPHFEGFVEEITPGDDANLVYYTALDPTVRATNAFTTMSQTWTNASTPAVNAYPRIVFNANNIDNDDDYVYQRAEGYTVGQIIATILNDHRSPLAAVNACPDASPGSPYVDTDLSAVDYVPQEKVVFESEGIRSACSRLLQMYDPAWRLFWVPGTRKWRFGDISEAPGKTVTLNDWDADFPVLSMNLTQSMAERYTSIKFYGPETLTPTTETTSTGGLTPMFPWTLENLGSVEVIGYSAFQVTNPARRRMAPYLPGVTDAEAGAAWSLPVKSPMLQMRWGDMWLTIIGAYFDFYNGIAYTKNPVYFYSSEGVEADTGIQHFFPPDEVRLIFAYLDAPIQVRYPEIGYEGTAYTVAGLENTFAQYDEMLAVGRNWVGTPVTTVARLAAFSELGRKILNERKDIVYSGGLVLDGLDWSYKHLGYRLNIAAVDGNNTAVDTGWEGINAWITDIEYDWSEGLTTIQLSSDHAEMIGLDVDLERKKLKIRALQLRMAWSAVISWRPMGSKWNTSGNSWYEMSGVHANVWFYWEDPITGETEV